MIQTLTERLTIEKKDIHTYRATFRHTQWQLIRVSHGEPLNSISTSSMNLTYLIDGLRIQEIASNLHINDLISIKAACERILQSTHEEWLKELATGILDLTDLHLGRREVSELGIPDVNIVEDESSINYLEQ